MNPQNQRMPFNTLGAKFSSIYFFLSPLITRWRRYA